MAIAINIAYIFPAIMNFIYSLLISFSLGKCTKEARIILVKLIGLKRLFILNNESNN